MKFIETITLLFEKVKQKFKKKKTKLKNKHFTLLITIEKVKKKCT